MNYICVGNKSRVSAWDTSTTPCYHHPGWLPQPLPEAEQGHRRRRRRSRNLCLVTVFPSAAPGTSQFSFLISLSFILTWS